MEKRKRFSIENRDNKFDEYNPYAVFLHECLCVTSSARNQIEIARVHDLGNGSELWCRAVSTWESINTLANFLVRQGHWHCKIFILFNIPFTIFFTSSFSNFIKHKESRVFCLKLKQFLWWKNCQLLELKEFKEILQILFFVIHWTILQCLANSYSSWYRLNSNKGCFCIAFFSLE